MSDFIINDALKTIASHSFPPSLSFTHRIYNACVRTLVIFFSHSSDSIFQSSMQSSYMQSRIHRS